MALPKPSTKFRARLAKASLSASMGIADLSVWFERPYATVHSWIHSGRTPRGARLVSAEAQLRALEICLEKSRGLPVPHNIRINARAEYVEAIRDRFGARVLGRAVT